MQDKVTLTGDKIKHLEANQSIRDILLLNSVSPNFVTSGYKLLNLNSYFGNFISLELTDSGSFYMNCCSLNTSAALESPEQKCWVTNKDALHGLTNNSKNKDATKSFLLSLRGGFLFLMKTLNLPVSRVVISPYNYGFSPDIEIRKRKTKNLSYEVNISYPRYVGVAENIQYSLPVVTGRVTEVSKEIPNLSYMFYMTGSGLDMDTAVREKCLAAISSSLESMGISAPKEQWANIPVTKDMVLRMLAYNYDESRRMLSPVVKVLEETLGIKLDRNYAPSVIWW